MKQTSDKHEIFVGFKKENIIEAKLLVGAAFKDTGTTYYKIRLMMFPGYTYYLVKNRDSADRYTVYSRAITENNQMKFLNPVGSANLDSKLQSYLEVRFPILRASMFMSLYPVKQHHQKDLKSA